MRFLKRHFSPEEIFLCILALLAGIGMTAWVFSLGLTTSLTDQHSHLNFARLTFDSLTPGISQLGFWPPLLHVLMIIPVMIPVLYNTGLAGAVVLIPFLCMGTILLYRTCLLLTTNRFLSIVAAAAFCLNPYVLYYSATPMMEVLLMANVFGAAYFLARWIDGWRIQDLLLAGGFVSLACLSRFEGIVLLPIVGIIILIQVLRRRTTYHEAEALAIFFALAAFVGLTFIMLYSWVFGGTPLAFSGGAWVRDPEENIRLARHNIPAVVQYVLHASYAMLGSPLVWLSILSGAVLMVLPQKRFLRFAVLLTLISPLIFVLLPLYMGSITINVPELPPFSFYHNDRYCLTWIGFAILAPVLLLDAIAGWMKRRGQEVSARRLIIGGAAVLLLFTGYRLVQASFIEKFDVIRRNVNSPVPEQLEMATYLREHYDYGDILTGRVDNDPILSLAGIPLRNYIYEGNYRFFGQSLAEPWLFARWVMMHNNADNADPWVAQNETIHKTWAESPEFARYYRLVLENGKRRLYKLRDETVVQLAKARGYNPLAIHSLQTEQRPWDPKTVYADMQDFGDAPKPASLLASPTLFKEELRKFYETRLLPDYRGGYFVNANRTGNSESQSYAMQQALWMDDRETFERVWQWTEKYLQNENSLFAWKFSIVPGTQAVRIDDANSATDADTDIAHALFLAADRWSVPEYRTAALAIIRGIWEIETVETPHGRHVLAGNWANESGSIVMNPSYFSPVAYRLFMENDPNHDWNLVLLTGYRDVSLASEKLSMKRTFLPPNWVRMDKETGEMGPVVDRADSEDYSYDAFRTLWRTALDDALFASTHANDYLARVTIFDENLSGRFCSVYFFTPSPQGSRECQLSMGTLAGPLSLWSRTNPQLARQLLARYFIPEDAITLPEDAAFYEKSWYFHALWLWTMHPQVQTSPGGST